MFRICLITYVLFDLLLTKQLDFTAHDYIYEIYCLSPCWECGHVLGTLFAQFDLLLGKRICVWSLNGSLQPGNERLLGRVTSG